MLWDHLTMNPAWLARYTDLSGEDVRSLAFDLAVQELHLVRRYAAKLSYELSLHRGDFVSAAGEYAAKLSEATLFEYSEDDYLIDVDPGFNEFYVGSDAPGGYVWVFTKGPHEANVGIGVHGVYCSRWQQY